MGNFIVIALAVFNIFAWIIILIRFKKLFSTDDIIADTKESCNSILKDLNSNVDRNITLIDRRIETLASLIKDADKRIKLLSDIEKSNEVADIFHKKNNDFATLQSLSGRSKNQFDTKANNLAKPKSARGVKAYESANTPILPARNSEEDTLVDIASTKGQSKADDFEGDGSAKAKDADLDAIGNNVNNGDVNKDSQGVTSPHGGRARKNKNLATPDDSKELGEENNEVDVGNIFDSVTQSIERAEDFDDDSYEDENSDKRDEDVDSVNSDGANGVAGGINKPFDGSGEYFDGKKGFASETDEASQTDGIKTGEGNEAEDFDDEDEDYGDDINRVGEDFVKPRRSRKNSFLLRDKGADLGSDTEVEGAKESSATSFNKLKNNFNPTAFVNPKLTFKEQVITMFDSGMSVNEISQALSRSAVEIQLVLDVEGR